jgi:hypothetical protein
VVHDAPWCRVWAFSSFGFEHHHISYFYGMFISFLFFGLFMPLNFVWAPLIIEVFFFVSLTCPLVWGVILAKVIFLKKNILGSKGDCKEFSKKNM